MSDSLILDPTLFARLFVDVEEPLLNEASWFCALDYHAITPENCTAIAETLEHFSDTRVFAPSLRAPFAAVLETYSQRRTELAATLWIIEVPILLMLLFYICMVSRLILNYEKNEMAVLQSRGASRLQTAGIYLFQAIFLSAAALVSGPFLSLVFCRMIGASNGFMEFVGRKGLPVELTASEKCGGGYLGRTLCGAGGNGGKDSVADGRFRTADKSEK